MNGLSELCDDRSLCFRLLKCVQVRQRCPSDASTVTRHNVAAKCLLVKEFRHGCTFLMNPIKQQWLWNDENRAVVHQTAPELQILCQCEPGVVATCLPKDILSKQCRWVNHKWNFARLFQAIEFCLIPWSLTLETQDFARCAEMVGIRSPNNDMWVFHGGINLHFESLG